MGINTGDGGLEGELRKGGDQKGGGKRETFCFCYIATPDLTENFQSTCKPGLSS